MAGEVICGQCRERWNPVEPGETDLCPRCRASSGVVAAETPSAFWKATQQLAFTESAPAAESSSLPGDEPTGFPLLAGALGQTPCGDSGSLAGDNPADTSSSLRTTLADFPHDSPTTRPVISQAPPPAATGAAASDILPAVTPVAARGAGDSPETTARMAAGRPTLTCRLAVSYASAITLACLYLVYLLTQQSSTLDLPDLAPPAKSPHRTTTLLYVPFSTTMPPAHRLALGESRQYGSIRVTPLRVTRGPLEFEFQDPAVGEERPPSRPVLKLHLRFENVSAEQVFSPLDRHLVFAKEPDDRHFGRFKANNLLCAAESRLRPEQHVLVYDLSPESQWTVRDENLDRELQPGDSIDSFIPTTEEGWDKLSGPLVWRVHLRKGYNPTSFRGVTTLIEILFHSADIIDEAAIPVAREV
jgi:hypothetical protein